MSVSKSNVGFDKATALVRPGENLATFCIRLPRFTGLHSTNEKMLGQLVDLYATSTGNKRIPYNMTFWLEQEQRYYNFFIKTNLPQQNKISNVAAKLDTHFAAMEKEYPLMDELPSMTYNQDDDENPHFELELPPRTAMYSSSELFFNSLGFAKNQRIQRAAREITVAGRGGKRTSVREVWGVFNRTAAHLLVLGDPIFPGGTMDAEVPEEAFPAQMHIQVEILNSGQLELQMPDGEPEEQEVTTDNAARLLDLQFERIRERLHLKVNPLEVITGRDGLIYIGNRASPGSHLRLLLRFNDRMSEAFGWVPGQTIVFPLETARTYDINIAGPRDDPFEGLYPINLKMSSYGQAISYVDGVGYTAVMGWLRDRTDKRSLISSSNIYVADGSYITIEFLDKFDNRVVFKDEHKITMLLMFQSL